MRRLFNKLRNLFSHHCPSCNGKMKAEMIDMEFDKMIYKCTVCGKEWV